MLPVPCAPLSPCIVESPCAAHVHTVFALVRFFSEMCRTDFERAAELPCGDSGSSVAEPGSDRRGGGGFAVKITLREVVRRRVGSSRSQAGFYPPEAVCHLATRDAPTLFFATFFWAVWPCWLTSTTPRPHPLQNVLISKASIVVCTLSESDVWIQRAFCLLLNFHCPHTFSLPACGVPARLCLCVCLLYRLASLLLASSSLCCFLFPRLLCGLRQTGLAQGEVEAVKVTIDKSITFQVRERIRETGTHMSDGAIRTSGVLLHGAEAPLLLSPSYHEAEQHIWVR